ncbi:MAG TPA: BPSS1780 family membrane protein [Accumulibacter sp.]|uniref:BPSS1780 family membrane protein n=1 Tax=Accumulibacter sp. TaxID=2053492 RepID=UPI0025DD6952|nr:BPSS1780 family membrane protein [Accumulibacter sp.]MCM8599275.1 hypothetical protein [Accumulibacter sp.]MCM8663436.1 hypothetical protein [Accumulibacter sp.]HNC51539.1 BPSS1780 family membrane protein [Accumulibacter sp.]
MSSEDNPFQVPVAQVHDYTGSAQGTFVPEGRLVPAGRGYHWLLRGWTMFVTAPVTWIGIAAVFMAVVWIVGMIPIINVAVNLLLPVFIGGISVGCRAIEDGEGIRFEHLFAGFSRQPGALLLVGLLYLVALVVLAVVIGVVGTVTGAVALATVGRDNAGGIAVWTMVVFFLATVLVFAPLAMAVWLAPPLVVFQEISAYEAIRISLLVALRNFPPFLVYGVLVLGASILASLPLLLGWLVWLPVLYASLYAAYRDLFFAE